jgi:YebC/PmpR family DNA-binding regulatory protein
MSGHSKWSTIKRQKGAADAKRSTTFTKLANAITIAARDGGGDASANFKLRLAIEKAREANMPKDNIDRAVKRGTGELGGITLENITYEAYAPGGAAILIDVNTDNRNRAISSIKAILHKYGAKLAESGAVGYLFHPRGIMTVKGDDIESTELAIIESGADDYTADANGSFAVFTPPKETAMVAKTLEEAGLTVENVELSQEPINTVMIEDPKTAQTLMTLMEQLEELDDVSSVYSNFDIKEVSI